MRFYEFEAKQLLAKQGIATLPHPRPLSRARERGASEGIAGLSSKGRS